MSAHEQTKSEKRHLARAILSLALPFALLISIAHTAEAYTVDRFVWTERSGGPSGDWSDAASSGDGQTIAAVKDMGYLYLSTDGGATWDTPADITVNGSVRAWSSIDISDDGETIAATDNGGYIYVSTDGGNAWHFAELGDDDTDSFTSISVTSDGTKMIATAADRMYLSTNSGGTWTDLGSSHGRLWAAAAYSGDGSAIFALETGDQIYKSTDDGSSFTRVINVSSGISWTDIAVSYDGSEVLASSFGNVSMYTHTGDEPWGFSSHGYTGVRSISMSNDGRVQAIASDSEYLYISKDAGATWNIQNLEFPDSGNWSAITVSGDGTHIAAGLDGGKIWTAASTTLDISPAISTCDQLQDMLFYPSGDYELSADVDCSETNPNDPDFDAAGRWSNGKGFIPVGDEDTPFTGEFDGAGHSIDRLYTNPIRDYVGIFGAASGSIHDVSLTNASITTSFNHVGGIVGRLTAGGSVATSTVSGSITGNTWVGGLVGTNEGSISHSSSTATMSGWDDVGGLVGSNADGAISFSFAEGNVTADGGNSIGGLVGILLGGSVSDSYALGSVSGGEDGTEIGGLVGDADGEIARSFSSGAVTGGTNVGGLVGKLRNAGDVSDSYARGDVTGHGNKIGGFAGALDSGSIVQRSYSSGNTYGTYHTGTQFSVGGFAGDAVGSVIGSFSAGAVNANNFIQVGGFAGYSMGGAVESSGWWSLSWGYPLGSSQGVTFAFAPENKEDFKSPSYAFYEDTSWDFSVNPVWSIDSGEYPRANAGWPYLVALSDAYDQEEQETVVNGGYVPPDNGGDEGGGDNGGGDNGGGGFGDMSDLVPVHTTSTGDAGETRVTLYGTVDFTALFQAFEITEEQQGEFFDAVLTSPESMFLGFVFDTEDIDGFYGTPVFANSLEYPNFSATITDGLECDTTYYAKAVFAVISLGISTEATSTTFTTLPCGSESESGQEQAPAPAPAQPRQGSSRRSSTLMSIVSAQPSPLVVISPKQTNLATRDLETGAKGQDVRELQKFLNAHGYAVSTNGPGSAGSETEYYGQLTRAAVAAFQRANGITPAAGYFGPITRAKIKSLGFADLWW